MSDFNRPVDAAGDPIARMMALLRSSEPGIAPEVAPIVTDNGDLRPVSERSDSAERMLALDVWIGIPAGSRHLDAESVAVAADAVEPSLESVIDHIVSALR